MSKVEVQIKQEILQWVIRETEFANVPAQIIQLLHSWINGEKKPTFSQIENVSKKTHIPFGYFFLNTPPENECEIVEYRTVDSTSITNPSRELIDTVNIMTAIQEWMSEHNQNEGNDPFEFVGKYELDRNTVSDVVTDIRKKMDLSETWFDSVKSSADSFRYLRKRISDMGIMVMANGVVGNNTHRKLNVKEFRAFTLINRYALLIFINSCDTDNGKLFSLIHELAHIWLGEESLYNTPYGEYADVSSLETFCNAVAAEILVPHNDFVNRWDAYGKKDNDDKINDAAKVYHCSRYVIARRAYDNNKISLNEYKRIIGILNQQLKDNNNRSKGNGADYYNVLQSKWDHNFIRILNSSVKNGSISYINAYRLTGMKGNTFDRLVSEIGGGNG